MTAAPVETAVATPTFEVPVRPIERLWEATGLRGAHAANGILGERRLGGELGEAYDGELAIALRSTRPTVVANFVETIDGAVALAPGTRSGGADVSGHDPTDRFVMGLLRALCDVILVGAGTVRSAGRSGWSVRGPDEASTRALAEVRHQLGLAPQPTTLVATRSGDLSPDLAAFQRPAAPMVIAAPASVVPRLRERGFGADVRIVPLGRGSDFTAAALIEVAASLGAALVLSEAGPHLTAELAAAALLDELFVTVAPRLVGRDDRSRRLALLEGVALWPGATREGALISVRRAGDTLFLRYRFEEVDHV